MAQAPLEREHQELIAIARMMEAVVPRLAPRLEAWADHLGKKLGVPPLAAEATLHAAALALRHVWLEAAASATSKSYRSPTEKEPPVTPAGPFANFGYERDLHPVALETRCAAFFDAPPPGWAEEHVLFSSGQAAMNALLTLLSARQQRPLCLRHDGCYFETVELLDRYRARLAIAA